MGRGGVIFDISKTEGMWPKQDEKLHINVLKLSRTKQKLLNSFKEHINVMIDSNTAAAHTIAAAHTSNIGGIKSDLRDNIPFDIWQLVSKRQIWISAAHIPNCENVTADKSFGIFDRSSE